MYRGREPTLDGRADAGAAAARRRMLCRKALTSRRTKRAARPPPILDADAFTGIKDGAYADARRRRSSSATATASSPPTLSGSAAARIRGMMAVRDAVRLVFRTQLEDAPEERITEARKLLNEHL